MVTVFSSFQEQLGPLWKEGLVSRRRPTLHKPSGDRLARACSGVLSSAEVRAVFH